MTQLKNFFSDEQGQDLIEYTLLLAFVALAVTLARRRVTRCCPSKTFHLNLTAVSAAFFAIAFASAAFCAPIVYTDQVLASGTLGVSAFTNVLVTATFVGDTTNVGPCLPATLCNNIIGTATVNVAGVGTATFITDTYEAFNDTTAVNGKIGIGDFTLSASILDTDNTAFLSYDLKSAVGPIAGPHEIRTDITYSTTLGGFHLTDASGASTFTATLVPEPASSVFLFFGLVVLFLPRIQRNFQLIFTRLWFIRRFQARASLR